jgi:formylglycine-generating enzyme required for sulfatase activity
MLHHMFRTSLLLLVLATVAQATVPVVTNVVATQRTGTKLVDIYYDAFDDDGDLLKARVEISHSAGATYSVPALALSGDVGQSIPPGAGKHIIWNAGLDWDGEYSDLMRVKVIVSDSKGLPGLEWGHEVPSGGFLMGQDSGVEGIGPARHVNIPWSYWLSKYEITIQQYVDYLNMALITGEAYRSGTSAIKSNDGIYEGVPANAVLVNLSSSRDILWDLNSLEVLDDRTNFPVNATWYGAIAFAQHYGYDLPTEAEWEKAARGPDHHGLEEHQLYPWGDTLARWNANYSGSGDPYETGSENYRSATPVGYYDGNQTPLGSDMATGYGLYDMAGNMFEWCRSKLASTVEAYPQIESLTNSLHTLSLAERVLRGGGWGAGGYQSAELSSLKCYSRSSESQSRDYWYRTSTPSYLRHDLGFRVIRRSVSVDPTDAVVTVSRVFNAVGGVPPYTWSIESGIGSISPTTGYSTTYTRLSSGNNTITCTDAAGLSASSSISQP